MRLRRLIVPLAIALQVGWLPGPAPAIAESPPQAGHVGGLSRAAVQRVTTELVLIETYVTDTQGRPIPGLTADDFELLVDGKPRPIATFEYREVVTPGAGGPPGAAVATAPPRAATTGRRFMMFFEDGTSGPDGLNAARRAADRFLATALVPSDEVAVAVYDDRLRLLHDFTTDREAVRQVIAASLEGSRRISAAYTERLAHEREFDAMRAEVTQTGATATMKAKSNRPPAASGDGAGGAGGGRRGAMSQGGSSSTPGGGQSASSPAPSSQAANESMQQLADMKTLALSYASEETVYLKGVLRALGILVDSLAGWPGYKAVVYMGDGIPENAALPYVQAIDTLGHDPILSQRAQQFDLAPEVEALQRAAAAAGVTMHALQTQGLVAGTGSELQRAYGQANTIAALALGTGGLRSSSNDFVQALDDFQSSSRAYYVIGYAPTGEPDGRYHQVRVRCRKRAAHVHAREGFTRLTPDDARRREIQAAHVLPDLYADMRLDFSAAIGPVAGSKRLVDLVVHVPADAVVFVPEEGRPTAHLMIGVVAIDERLSESFHAARTVQIARQGNAARDVSGIDLYARIRLPDGAQTLTTVVYDDTAGKAGAARLALPASAQGADPILGLSLYAPAEPGLWVEVPFDDAPAAAHESLPDYPVGPSLRTTFAAGESPLCAFRRPAGDETRLARLRVAITRDGKVLRTVAPGTAKSARSASVQVPLPVDGLPPDNYQVTVQEQRQDAWIDLATVPLRLQPPMAAPAE
jgi:VWFA-related protein